MQDGAPPHHQVHEFGRTPGPEKKQAFDNLDRAIDSYERRLIKCINIDEKSVEINFGACFNRRFESFSSK